MPEENYSTILKLVHIKNLSVGLHTDINPFDIPLGGCVECSNLVWVNGYLRPRPGLTEAYDTNSSRAIAHFNRFTDNAQTTRLMRLDYASSNLYPYSHDGSWSALPVLAGVGSASIPPTSAAWKGQWWFTSGNGGLYRYDPTGPTIATVASLQSTQAKKVPDKPRLVVAADSRLFIADCHNKNDGSGTRVPYRVAWCDFLDGTVWNSNVGGGSSGYVDLANDSDPVTGLYYSGSVLMVFKPTSFYLGVPAAPPKQWDFKQKVTGIGCIAHQTIKKYRDGWIFWLGDDNVYRGGTDRNPEAIGDAIRPRLREAVLLSDITKARAFLDRVNHLYHLILPSAAVADSSRVIKIFTLNALNGSWWEGTLLVPSIDVTDTLDFRASEWEYTLLVATASGKIYELTFSATTDAGALITTSWKSGMLTVPDFTQGDTEQARIQQMRIYANEGNATLGLWYGDAPDRMELHSFGTQTCDGESEILVSELPFSGENFQLQINQDDAAEGAHIAKLAVGVAVHGRSRR